MSKEVYRLEIPIVIQDEYSKEIKKIQDALKGIKKKKPKLDIDINEKEARRKIEELQKKIAEMSKRKNKPKIDIDNRPATKKIGETQRKLSSFQRFANRLNRMKLSVQDNASRMITRVQQRLDQLKNSKVGQITISAVDKTRGVFASVRRAVTSLPGMVTIGLSVVGGAKAVSAIKGVVSDSMRSAMDWEVNEVALMHRLNDNEKLGKKYMAKIGRLADLTPYSSPDLIPAYTQALVLSQKDPEKAFNYTRIAADMAALTPGRDPVDAMSALLGAQMGNYQQLEAYGFKITQELAEGMGGFDGVFNEIVKEYEGGAAKLSQTNSGIISTLQGYQGSLKRSFGQGLLKPIGEELQRVSTFIDNNQDGWGRTKDVVSSVGLAISTGIVDRLKGAASYVSDLSSIMLDGIEIERDEHGTITNAGEVGHKALENLQNVKDKITSDMGDWWDTTGRTKLVDAGKALGEGAIEAIVAGVPMIAEAMGGLVKDQFKKAWENPSVGSIAGAALAGGGALYGGYRGIRGAYRGVKGLYEGGRGVWNTGKKAGRFFGFGGRTNYQQRPKKTRSTFYERDRRAREWSMRPENYRPPKQPKTPKNYNLGFSSGGPMAGIPKWLRGGSKGIMSKLPGLNVAFAGYDGFRGWQDADRRTGGNAGALDKAASALSSIAEGFSFGLIDGDKAFETIRGKKVPTESDMMHIDPMHDMDPRMRHGMNEDGSMDSRFSSAEGTTFASDFDDPFDMFNEEMNALVESVTSAKETFEAMNEGLEGMDEFTESFSAVSEMFESLKERMEAFEELAEPMESFGENFTAISEMLEETRERLEQFSETMAEPAEQLSEALPQIAEQIVEMQERLEEFSEMMAEPAEQMAEAFPLLAEQIVEMQERLEEFAELVTEPADQFVESFTQVSEMMEQMRERLEEFSEATAEPSEMYVQNLTMMAELLEQSTEIVTEMNEMISEQSALLGENMTVLGENLLQSGQIVQEGFTAIGAKSQEVVAALNTLISHINTGAQAMSGLQQVQTHVSALNTALAGLASRVSNVQVPSSVSVGGVGPVRAYAKGGIATSPHIGLVAEAGVPEAMIPFDGSQRSKDLWMTTGHALGMFDTSTSEVNPTVRAPISSHKEIEPTLITNFVDTNPLDSLLGQTLGQALDMFDTSTISEVNPYALDPIDTSEPTTSTSSGGVVINNDIPIDIKSGANKEEIINRTLKEVEQKLRLVLETT